MGQKDTGDHSLGAVWAHSYMATRRTFRRTHSKTASLWWHSNVLHCQEQLVWGTKGDFVGSVAPSTHLLFRFVPDSSLGKVRKVG